jgi:O-antigen ligase
MRTRNSLGPSTASCYVYLIILSLTFAYAVFQSGGILRADWEPCMVSLGLLVLIYLRFTRKEDLAPSPQWWFRWPPLLFLAFVAFQLVPLPEPVLRAISPARADLLQSLEYVLPGTDSATLSVFPSATLAHLLRIAAYIVVFIITRELAWQTLGQRWLMTLPIVLVAGVEAVWGILQYSPDTVARGSYLNRNHFAGLLEMALPFAAVYPIAVQRTGRRPLSGQSLFVSISVGLAVLMLLGIILSLSRMGFASAVAALIVAGSLILSERASAAKRFAVTALVAIAVIAGSFYLAPDPLVSRFAEIREAPENVKADDRVRVWKETLVLAAEYSLVGCGLGAFEHAFNKYRTFLPELAINTVHNDYLQLLAELGVIGFALGASVILAVFLAAVRAAFGSGDPSTRYLAVACLSSLIAILIHSFTDYNLYIPANAMLLAWIAGIVASLEFESKAALKI